MKLTTYNPEGVHAREIKGLTILKESLPAHWFGYASFEMIGHDGGEIDLVICADDRLIAVEIKDWNENIVDHGNTWETRRVGIVKSPVILIGEKARKLGTKFNKFLAQKYEGPLVDHCVLLTGTSKRCELREDSREKTFELEFFKGIGGKGTFAKCFPRRAYLNVPREALKIELDKFFSAARVRPQSLSYSGYKAEDDPCYVHPKRIYSEFLATKTGARGFNALLRCWDFDKLGEIEPAYHNLESRKLLALREENAIGYLREAKPELSQRNVFLAPIANEGRDSVTDNFFELYDLPTNLNRLKVSLQRFGEGLKEDNRVSLARVLLSHFSELHELEVTHRDIGEHCIWVSIPDKVSLSGFATSSFPEQKTVSQIRETIRAGTERVPEDILECKSNNYQKDVFLLGSVVHQIFFGKRAESSDGFPAWAEPRDGKFKRFWSWFDRCLDIDPERRFPDAMAAFEEFQRCDGLMKQPSVSEADFSEFTKRFQPQPRDTDTIIREDEHALVFRVSDSEVGSRLVKVWANARFSPGAASDNFQLLEFFKRIQKLQIKDLPAQQKIIDFGHTKYGSFVSLQWEEGSTLDQCDFTSYDDQRATALLAALVRAVADMHGSSFYHGDLKPENILLIGASGEDAAIRLIDCIDFAPNGTQRRSSAYLPPEGETASTPACDGYALWKIVTAFLFTRMSCVSEQLKQQVDEILESILDPDGGDPDLTNALRELEKVASAETEEEDDLSQETIISIDNRGVDFVLAPDDRGLPVEVFLDDDSPDCFVVAITGQDRSLNVRFDASARKVVDVRSRRSGLVDIIRAMRRPVALLRHPIRVQSRNEMSLQPLVALLKEEGVLEHGMSRIRDSKPAKNYENIHEIIQPAESDSSEHINAESVCSDAPVQLEALWEALIEAELRILPVVTITSDPVVLENVGVIVFPVGEASKPFDFHDDEQVHIENKDREGQWRYYGNLDTRRTTHGSLAVIMRAKGTFIPTVNSSLRLVNTGSKNSYDRRQGAIRRILGGTSACPNLIKYYACDEDVPNRTARFTTRFAELDRYNLNPEQADALKTALSSSPLAMIQGPPGTGKTNVISAAVHYIASNYRSSRILVVSQSHEAIDHATEQIVKQFRKHGDEPSLVRVGRRAAVSDNLISFHSESLQGEYRERFRLSLSSRIAPVGARLGLSKFFIESLTLLRARLVPILRQLITNSEGDVDSNPADSVEFRSLRKACRQLDPDFDPEGVEVSSIYKLLEERLAIRYGETDMAAVKALREVIDLALEWIQILEAPGKLDRFYVRASQIVTGTCVGVGRWDLGIEGETFDCVIIDEAARCGPSDLAVASQVAEQVILLGDHKQLPPFLDKEIIDSVSEELGCPQKVVEQSDFQRLFRSAYAGKAGRTLKIQYRMREPIGRLVSECFYPEVGGLEPGRFESADVYGRMPKNLETHVTWVDTGNGEEERIGTSFINRHEIDRIMALLEELAGNERIIDDLILDANNKALPAAIGIIAAYKVQANAIEERIWASTLPERLRSTCKVDTVDSYQGKENPIIIFSAVRCNLHEEIGFIRSWERVNVSLSRARERLVIVGSWKFWLQSGERAPLGKVAHYLEARINSRDHGYKLLKHETIKE